MKTLFLLFNRIKRYIVKNKALFILFTIGSILTSTFFAYFYGNTEFMQRANDTKLSNRKYLVSLQEPLSYDSEELRKLYNSEFIDSIRIINNSYEDIFFSLCTCIKGDVPSGTASGRTEFREGENYSIVPDSLSKFRIGDTVVIDNIEFTVIGTAVLDSHISNYAFAELDLDVHLIEIYSAEKYRPGQDGKLINHIITSLTDSNIDYIKTPDVTKNSDILFEIIALCVCFSLAVVSFMFLLKYMLDSIMDETAISLIVGASKLHIFLITFGEIMCFSLISSAIGVIMHRILYEPVFSKLNKIESTTYLASDYFYIYVIFNLLTAFVSLFFILRYASLTPREARSRIA